MCRQANLSETYNTKLEPETVQRFGREYMDVKIPASDKYIETLKIFHEVHCNLSPGRTTFRASKQTDRNSRNV